MSFVKSGDEGSGEASAEAALLAIAQAGAATGGTTAGEVAGGVAAVAAVAHAGSAIASLVEGASGAPEGSAPVTGATAPPFMGASATQGPPLPANVAGIPGMTAGLIAGATAHQAGAVSPLAGVVAGAIPSASVGGHGAIGPIPGFAGGVTGNIPVPGPVGVAPAAIAGAIAGHIPGVGAAASAIQGIAGGVTGQLSGAVGAASAIQGIAGGIPGHIPGASVAGASIPGIAGGAIGGIPGVAADMPIFEDIAVTTRAASDAVSALEDELQGILDVVLPASFGPASGHNLTVEVASGDALDIRQFSLHERISSLFQVQLIVLSDSPDIDFDAVVGQPATFTIQTGGAHHEPRVWTGVVNHLQQIAVETEGRSTYQLSLVPRLWLSTQRRNHRMFQQISEPDIVLKLLKEWDITPDIRIDKAAYKKRKYRVQYGESDFAFMSRMLEDAGISFFFEQQKGETKLVLADAPQKSKPRRHPLRFFDSPTAHADRHEHVTHVRVGQVVRPGKYTIRDHDYRMPPSYQLVADHANGKGIENKLERFHYTPGAFLFGSDKGDATPSADDKGKTRTDQAEGALLAQKRLEAKRADAKVITFETNAPDIGPGAVIAFLDHPRADLGKGKKLLVIESSFSGSSTGEWHKSCEARSADVPYRPAMTTPKPKVAGIESATVVGPPGEEIHTDEFGRVRCHFHWDRESKMDDNSSCWIHVSQPWGGSGYGGISLPRVGQEVIVDFLGGDPDRPVIVGRLYTNLQKVPYKLPQDKTKSGWKSNSTNKTGGYNEIMFEDAAGRELVNIQAERDLTETVKHDATHTVKNDRSSTVWNNDSTLVGVQSSLTIAVPGDGKSPPSPGPTNVTMVHKRIELTTGEASIVLEGPNISFSARGNISSSAMFNTSVTSLAGAISVQAVANSVGINSLTGIGISTPSQISIDGPSGVFINCTQDPPAPIQESTWFDTAVTVAAFVLCPPLACAMLGAHFAAQALSH